MWTPAQLREVLGEDDGRWAATVFEVTERGTFEHGASVLQLPADPDDAERFERVRAALLAARLGPGAARRATTRSSRRGTGWRSRRWPKPVWHWMIRHCWHAALRCATAMLDLHFVDGRLRRASLGGVVGDSAAILEDYAALATGLLTLYQLTGDESWLATATELIGMALGHFADPDRPGRWFDTADDAEQLMVRPSDPWTARHRRGRR